MNLDAIAIGTDPPNEVNVIIEVPIGGEPIKYEMDKAAGTLVVDRFLYTPMRYPGNYGFIPHTLSEDGDPCDVLIANTRPIVAVPASRLTKRYERIENYTDLPEITLKQIEHFFAHYKDLEPGKWVKFSGWADAVEARRLIDEAIARAKRD